MLSESFREQLVDGLSDQIASCLDRGAQLDAVERGLSSPSLGLSVREEDSLRLFAWCYAHAGDPPPPGQGFRATAASGVATRKLKLSSR